MGLFDKIFGKKDIELKKYLSQPEIEERNKELSIKYEQLKAFFKSNFDVYYLQACQCAYPRYQQIVGIDCSDTRNSFKCYDTSLLIDLSRPYFDVSRSELKDEVKNELWVCKKCGSVYEYGWSDFSIY